MNDAIDKQESCSNPAYTERLIRLQNARWKRILGVQRPYCWNLRRLDPGFTLDIGCGIGRNLEHLRGNGVGIDLSEASVGYVRRLGMQAFTPSEFKESAYCRESCFDSLLFSHVLEHMTFSEAVDLVRMYLPFLKQQGRVIIISPQERGFLSDSTHVEFFDFQKLGMIARELELHNLKEYSFPFPAIFGTVFIYNEFVFVCRCN
jgi:SAM-dependent methyltransferase